MRLFLFYFVCFFLTIELSAQSQINPLDGAITVRTIESDDEDFSDLMPLVEKIGSSKVVALGEATHEDGATFKAKARLVKFLHQKMGFDVLLWESGLLDNWYMNAALRNDTFSLARAIAYERGRWGASEYAGTVFDYARQSWKTNHPLEMGGFDFGGAGTGSKTALSLLQFVIKKDPSINPSEKDSIAIDSLLRGFLTYASAKNLIVQKITASARNTGITAIKNIITKVENKRTYFQSIMSECEYNLVLFLLRNILDDLSIQMLFMANYAGGKFDGLAWNRRRDSCMAKRLFWLHENMYKGRKIILWGASSHFMKNSKGFITRGDSVSKWNYYQMGDYISKKLKNDYYCISFISFSGERGDVYPDKKSNELYGSLDTIPPRAINSFEQIAHQYGSPLFFFDLRELPENHWLRKPAIAYAFGNSKDKTDWSKMTDAFFFIDKMEPDKKRY